jgi:hypothetical protein
LARRNYQGHRIKPSRSSGHGRCNLVLDAFACAGGRVTAGRCARHSAEGFSWVFFWYFGTIIAYVVQGSFVKGPSRRVLIEGTHAPPASDKVIVAVVKDTAALLKASGEITVRGGIATTVLALSLAMLALLCVLAFHFPTFNWRATDPTLTPLSLKENADVRAATRSRQHAGPQSLQSARGIFSALFLCITRRL